MASASVASVRQVRPLQVDVLDARFYHRQLEVKNAAGCFELTLDPNLKNGQQFDLALFLDENAFSRKLLFRYPRRARVAVLQESPLRDFYNQAEQLAASFDWVFTFHEQLLALGAPFYRLDIGGSWLDEPIDVGVDGKTELVSFVGSIQHGDEGGYALRKAIAQAMLADERVHCFGRGIHEIEHKADALAAFRFSVAMENCQANFYYTEKLIDCFMAEVVPIYWGCPAIVDIFDPRGMLLFDDLPSLKAQLDDLSEAKYLAMRPYVLANRERALELGLTSYQGFYGRLLASMMQTSPALVNQFIADSATPQSAVGYKLQHSIWAAAGRYCCQRLLQSR